MFTVKSQLFCDHYWRTSQAWLCDSMSKRNGESVRPVPWIKSAALGRDPVGSWLNAVMVAHNCVPGTCLISFPIQGLCTAFSAGDSLTLLILPLGFNLSVTFLPKGALCTIVPLPINTPHPQPILCLLHNLHYDLSLFYLLVCCFFCHGELFEFPTGNILQPYSTTSTLALIRQDTEHFHPHRDPSFCSFLATPKSL